MCPGRKVVLALREDSALLGFGFQKSELLEGIVLGKISEEEEKEKCQGFNLLTASIFLSCLYVSLEMFQLHRHSSQLSSGVTLGTHPLALFAGGRCSCEHVLPTVPLSITTLIKLG